MLRSICRHSRPLRTRPRIKTLSTGASYESHVFCRFRLYEREPNSKTLKPSDLDIKWRAIWEKRAFAPASADGPRREAKGKMYILPMFPYPSGDLHLGHLRVYTISDVLARFRRMQGYNVIHPIGWDAFGLPAENAAIERGIDPASWTETNIGKMKAQLSAMNGNWDWDREFKTCDPDFYKHTQRLFLLLHKHGLAYQAESIVNYDPVDKTVLANEQVDSNGISWRSGAKVEKKLLKQWFLKISQFREELLGDLKYLSKDGAWPERVLAMQKNWLGKSSGARIKFPVGTHGQGTYADIEVFTTRPDTLFGVQYVALASTHPIVKALAKSDMALQAFIDTIPSLPQDSKVGYLLTDVRAINPLSNEDSTPDAVKAPLPIYVAPYVLGDYGDGAVMGVPGHDTRDHAFWKHNRYDDPIRVVISPASNQSRVAIENQPFVHQGRLTSHNGPYAGQSSAEASKNIIELLDLKNLGTASESWRLRDWLVSRQRYWGTPIPIIHCDSCGAVPVPEDQLPVKLPAVEAHWGKGKTGNPLESAHAWVNTECPKCHGPAKRDTDTMDTFVDSSWYFMRFIDPKHKTDLFSTREADKLLPVDIYIGGVEHAILHLLYSRFIAKFLSSIGLWNSTNRGEPFQKVLTQGMVHGKTYTDPTNGRFLKPDEVDLRNISCPIVIATGEKANVSFEKMSKSKYNGVDPSACMELYGADATRAHILFQAPVSEVLEWDEAKISGITRWHRRISEAINTLAKIGFPEQLHGHLTTEAMLIGAEAANEKATDPSKTSRSPEQWEETKRRKQNAAQNIAADVKLWRAVQTTIASVTASYGETFSLNTVVSDLMTLTNAIGEHASLTQETWGSGPAVANTSAGKSDDAVPPPGARLSAVQKAALQALVQMMAPITPAFAEECWARLHPRVPHLEDATDAAVASVFDYPFPEQDGTLATLHAAKQPCAVQVNGRFKLAVEIDTPPPDLRGMELETWIVGQIMATDDGRRKLAGTIDVKRARKVIVVRGGKTVNFVM